MLLSLQNMSYKSLSIKIKVSEKSGEVSGILVLPDTAEYIYLFAHGAGAGMNHSFMEKFALSLASVNIGTLRFNFPYAEHNSKRPDHASVLLQTIHSAYNAVKEYAKGIPVFAGGKSMGGRMSSMAASKNLLEGIKGLVFVGFPLHAPGNPSIERAEHLYKVKEPMLFLQGSKDKLADLTLLTPIVTKLENAVLYVLEEADHSFKLPKKAGKSEEEVLNELAATVKEWMRRVGG